MKRFSPGQYIYYQDKKDASLEIVVENDSDNTYEREQSYKSLVLISNYEEEGRPHGPEVGSQWEKEGHKINFIFHRRERIIRFIFTKELVY
jgi:hypothetical protein